MVTFKTCPECKKESFRPLDIWGDRIIWKCKSCNQGTPELLPDINKKVIYLDQSAISHMARSQLEGGEERWKKLYDRLSQLVADQVIICPESLYHEQESSLSKDMSSALQETYEALSKGVNLNNPLDIELKQLYQSWNKYIGQDTSNDYNFDWRDAFYENPNKWHGRIIIRSRLPRDPKEVEVRRKFKEIARNRMQKIYDDDYLKTEKTFEEELREEQYAHAWLIWDALWKNMKALAEQTVGLKAISLEDTLNLVFHHSSMILTWIGELELPPEENKHSIIAQFLFSDHFISTPYVYIESLILAALARKVRASGRKASLGDYFDVSACSHYLPYCDAMFLDNEYRGMLQEGGVSLHERYGTRLFSSKTMNEFNEYLDEIEQSNEMIDFIRSTYQSLDKESIF